MSRPRKGVDAYFSADVETDGPIPGRFSLLSLALVYAGEFDGVHFKRPSSFNCSFYRELKPISPTFEAEALSVNGLDRERLIQEGANPHSAMTEAAEWIKSVAGSAQPVLVAYPVSFDWAWLYWYFVAFSEHGSPFGYSCCYDVKTAFAVKSHRPISLSGRSKISESLQAGRPHTHNALDDAIEQAEIFGNLFDWRS